jgi:AhpD family alkylhydroperoxidase
MAQGQHRVRLAPPNESEWTSAARERLLGSWLSGGQAPSKPSPVRVTISRHEKLFEAWDPFGAAVFNGELPARDREVLILRSALLTRCRVEWAYHEPLGKRAGMSEKDIAAVVEGTASTALDPWDAVLVSVVDQLYETGTIDDPTWDALAARYTVEQLIEVPMVTGQYMMLAFALNAFGTPPPEGAPVLPSEDRD